MRRASAVARPPFPPRIAHSVNEAANATSQLTP